MALFLSMPSGLSTIMAWLPYPNASISRTRWKKLRKWKFKSFSRGFLKILYIFMLVFCHWATPELLIYPLIFLRRVLLISSHIKTNGSNVRFNSAENYDFLSQKMHRRWKIMYQVLQNNSTFSLVPSSDESDDDLLGITRLNLILVIYLDKFGIQMYH